MPRSVGNSAEWAPAAAALVEALSRLSPAQGSPGDPVRLLLLLGSAAPLAELLDGLVAYVESSTEGLFCSVLLADPTARLLRPCAAPQLPAAFLQSIDPLTVAVGNGSCGAAAALRQLVVVEDVERSDHWRDHAPAALANGLRACWSMPILAQPGVLLGTLALYSPAPRKPSDQELELLQFAALMAAFVIQRSRDGDRLRTSETRLLAAVDGADIGLWDCDQDGEGAWFDGWCQRLDIDPCEGPDRQFHWQKNIHPDDIDRYHEADHDCIEGTADQYAVEYRIRTRHGRWRWLHERGNVVLRDAQERPARYVGLCIDIDDRKTAELALRQSNERLRTFARLVHGFVFEGRLQSNRNIELTWADDAFAQIYDCDPGEANRRGWYSFVDPRDRAAVRKCLATVPMGTAANIELRIIGATGRKRWIRLAAEPLLDPVTGSISGLIGMVEDITDRKVLMEEMFESVNREQRRIGNDLHDELGQVLTGASLLLRGCHTSAGRGVAITPREIDRVLELVTGAIENTRLLAHGLAPGTLDGGGLTSALENLAHRARHWSGLEISLAQRPGVLGGLDATTCDHLYRIAQEAITNVARHANAQHAEIAARIEEDALVIEITDDGAGIPERITNGFGLRTMRYRADAIGADMAIEKVRPHGTRVSVRLPLHPASLSLTET